MIVTDDDLSIGLKNLPMIFAICLLSISCFCTAACLCSFFCFSSAFLSLEGFEDGSQPLENTKICLTHFPPLCELFLLLVAPFLEEVPRPCEPSLAEVPPLCAPFPGEVLRLSEPFPQLVALFPVEVLRLCALSPVGFLQLSSPSLELRNGSRGWLPFEEDEIHLHSSFWRFLSARIASSSARFASRSDFR